MAGKRRTQKYCPLKDRELCIASECAWWCEPHKQCSLPALVIQLNAITVRLQEIASASGEVL